MPEQRNYRLLKELLLEAIEEASQEEEETRNTKFHVTDSSTKKNIFHILPKVAPGFFTQKFKKSSRKSFHTTQHTHTQWPP